VVSYYLQNKKKLIWFYLLGKTWEIYLYRW